MALGPDKYRRQSETRPGSGRLDVRATPAAYGEEIGQRIKLLGKYVDEWGERIDEAEARKAAREYMMRRADELKRLRDKRSGLKAVGVSSDIQEWMDTTRGEYLSNMTSRQGSAFRRIVDASDVAAYREMNTFEIRQVDEAALAEGMSLAQMNAGMLEDLSLTNDRGALQDTVNLIEDIFDKISEDRGWSESQRRDAVRQMTSKPLYERAIAMLNAGYSHEYVQKFVLGIPEGSDFMPDRRYITEGDVGRFNAYYRALRLEEIGGTAVFAGESE